MNGAYLHELYFANVGDAQSRIGMDSLSYMRLNRDFGTFDDWQRDFIACGLSSRCGWAVTYLNMYTQSYMNCVIDLHAQNVPAGMYPVIVMDLWQHAYYRDYLKDASSYMSAMMKQLKWPVIEKRFEKADRILNILRGS
jgi:Fe-Mn family superoxide dismutase